MTAKSSTWSATVRTYRYEAHTHTHTHTRPGVGCKVKLDFKVVDHITLYLKQRIEEKPVKESRCVVESEVFVFDKLGGQRAIVTIKRDTGRTQI